MPRHTLRGRTIRQIGFGANDGMVTMLALIAGLSGAAVEGRIVILAGLAEMIAGALSMSVGEYLSTKAQVNYYREQMKREKEEIQTFLETQELFTFSHHSLLKNSPLQLFHKMIDRL